MKYHVSTWVAGKCYYLTSYTIYSHNGVTELCHTWGEEKDALVLYERTARLVSRVFGMDMYRID
jgi:hypothetical protein